MKLTLTVILGICIRHTCALIFLGNPGAAECFDKAIETYPKTDQACLKYSRMGYCSLPNQVSWMRKYCQRTCNFCTVPPGVEEINSFQYTSTLLDVNMALFAYDAKNHTVSSLEDCLKECSRSARINSDCQSVNFEMKQGSGQVCELNAGTKEQYPELFRKRPGYIYYEQSI